MGNKTVAIIQARFSSSRLPGKALLPICGRPLLALMIERVKRGKRIDEIWIACTDRIADDPIAALAEKEGVRCFRGDENDVLDRFLKTGRKSGGDVLVRLTGDCPLIDPLLVDEVVSMFQKAKGQLDYASNCVERTYPDGLDVEVFSREALEKAAKEAKHPFFRQHVTPYIHGRHQRPLSSGSFRIGSFKGNKDYSHLRWTVDEKEDYILVKKIFEALYPAKKNFGWLDVVQLQQSEPDLLKINDKYRCNEGADRDWERIGS